MVRNDNGRRREVTGATEDEQGSVWFHQGEQAPNGTSPFLEWLMTEECETVTEWFWLWFLAAAA